MVDLKLDIMKKVFLFFMLVGLLGHVQAQAPSYSTDSIEVNDRFGVIKKLEVKTSFQFLNDSLFNLDCSDKRVYSFLLPNTQFLNNSVISFQDTGYTLTMNDTVSVNINVSDSTSVGTSNLGILYQSLNTPHQIIMLTDSTGVKVIKNDKTYIKFY